MEMSEGLSQQERVQALAEKRRRQTEVENKKRQLEDDRRQLQHFKGKALRERWLLDGAPSAGAEQDEARKQLQEDEAKIKDLEESIVRVQQELEDLESGVSVSVASTKDSLAEEGGEEAQTPDNKVPVGSVEVITVHSGPRVETSGGPSDMMRAVVHEVREGAVENGFQQLSSSEVDELLHQADEASLASSPPAPAPAEPSPPAPPTAEEAREEGGSPCPAPPQTPPAQDITGMETTPGAPAGAAEPSAEYPVTMVFLGYQSVEDEAETKKVLGLEGTVTAQRVVIQDGPAPPAPAATVTITQETAQEERASPPLPPNGSAADPLKDPQEAAEEKGEEEGRPGGGAGEPNNTEKKPCKCCAIM